MISLGASEVDNEEETAVQAIDVSKERKERVGSRSKSPGRR